MAFIEVSPNTIRSPSEPRIGTHMPALDGVRGLALALVFFNHWGGTFGPWSTLGAGERFAARLSSAGWCGVDLFFVLSGFLITGILLDTRKAPDFFKTFYVRRTLRIFPLYYIFLFALFILFRPFLHAIPEYRALSSHQISYWLYLQNWQTSIRGWPSFGMDHLWSLAVEEQFYLVWPLIVFWGGRSRIVSIAGALIVLPFALRVAILVSPSWRLGSPENFAYASSITRVDALACGAWIAAVARGPGGVARIRRLGAPLAVISAAALIALVVVRRTFDKYDIGAQTLGFSLLAFLFSGVVMVLVTLPRNHRFERIFCWKPLRKLGTISYAAYIFHAPILVFIATYVHLGATPFAAGEKGIHFVLGVVVTLACAEVSWRYFEKRLLAFKDRVSPSSMRAPFSHTHFQPSSGSHERESIEPEAEVTPPSPVSVRTLNEH